MLQRRLLSFSDCSICLKIFNTFNIDWLHYSESSWRPLIAGLGPGGGSGHGVPDLALLMMLYQLVQVSQLMLCCCYCCCYKLSFFSDCCSICLVTSSEVYWCSKTEKRKKNKSDHDLEVSKSYYEIHNWTRFTLLIDFTIAIAQSINQIL